MDDRSRPAVLPADIIFSCSVCHATVSDVYAASDGSHGLHDSSNDDEQALITKLWLTECSHVTCSKHLEGGGVPFYPEGEQPRAVCPVCSSQSNDKERKDLYAIRGFLPGEYDPKIPKEWFESPPIRLGGKNVGMEAMTFHYIALVNFGTAMVEKMRKASEVATATEKQLTQQETSRNSINHDMEMLKTRIVELEKCEKELKPWRDRESEINFYLNLFPRIARENERLREQLVAMGYAVPNRSYNMRLDVNKDMPQTSVAAGISNGDYRNEPTTRSGHDDVLHSNVEQLHPPEQRNTYDNKASRSIDAVENLHTEAADQPQPKKRRTREELEKENVDRYSNSVDHTRGESRHLMPPPPLPSYKARSAPTRNGTNFRYLEQQQNTETPQNLSNVNLQLHPREQLQIGDQLRRRSPPIPPRVDSYELLERKRYDDPSQEKNAHRSSHLKTFDELENIHSSNHGIRPSDISYTDEERHIQPIRRESYWRGEGNFERPPLLEQNESSLNLQSYRYAPLSTAKHLQSPPRHANGITHNLRSSPAKTHYQAPSTPSPFKYANPPGGSIGNPQSVISPFFSRQSGLQHSGRMTMSTSSTTQPMLPPSRLSPRPQQSLLQTPHRLSRTSGARQVNLIYPQSTPAAQRLLTSNTPHMVNGLFRRPDALPPSISRHPASPYFNLRDSNQIPHTQFAPATPRPSFLTQKIRTLGSSTPSIRSNISVSQSQMPTHRPVAHSRHAAHLQQRELTEHDLVYGHRQTSREDYRYDHTMTGTGLKSGVSRPSNEFARDASGHSAGYGTGRRSIQR